jgi:predicted nucleotidyltransferase
MDLAEPMLSVTPSVTGSVLAALARTSQSVTGRALEGRVKPPASHRGVQEALRKLVRSGIVDRVDKGGAALYSLNREHLAAPAILQLARLRDELLDRVAAEIGGWSVAPQSVALFGSFARGEGDADSDIDMLVVRSETVARDDESWREQLARLNQHVLAWTGNPLRVIELSVAEFNQELAHEEPYLSAAIRDGITVGGSPLAHLRPVTT